MILIKRLCYQKMFEKTMIQSYYVILQMVNIDAERGCDLLNLSSNL